MSIRDQKYYPDTGIGSFAPRSEVVDLTAERDRLSKENERLRKALSKMMEWAEYLDFPFVPSAYPPRPETHIDSDLEEARSALQSPNEKE